MQEKCKERRLSKEIKVSLIAMDLDALGSDIRLELPVTGLLSKLVYININHIVS